MSSNHRAGSRPAIHLVTTSSPHNRETEAAGTKNTWCSVERAARLLDIHPTTLKRHLENNVYRAVDGGTEARFDGILARKLGGRWKLLLGPLWVDR